MFFHRIGLESVFQDGRLICGSVAISKGASDKAHVVIESSAVEDFFKVREVIYSQYADGAVWRRAFGVLLRPLHHFLANKPQPIAESGVG